MLIKSYKRTPPQTLWPMHVQYIMRHQFPWCWCTTPSKVYIWTWGLKRSLLDFTSCAFIVFGRFCYSNISAVISTKRILNWIQQLSPLNSKIRSISCSRVKVVFYLMLVHFAPNWLCKNMDLKTRKSWSKNSQSLPHIPNFWSCIHFAHRRISAVPCPFHHPQLWITIPTW